MENYRIKYGSAVLYIQKKSDSEIIGAWSFNENDKDLSWFKTDMYSIESFARINNVTMEKIEPKQTNLFNIDDL